MSDFLVDAIRPEAAPIAPTHAGTHELYALRAELTDPTAARQAGERCPSGV